jgi:hypothetical protein
LQTSAAANIQLRDMTPLYDENGDGEVEVAKLDVTDDGRSVS